MKVLRKSSSRPIREILGFGLGCLLGGLTGVGFGWLCRTEVAIITCYGLGFIGGGLLGSLLTRRMTK